MVGSSKPALDELDVYGGMAIGTGYAGTTAAPTNGLIVQGNVGIGTNNPLGYPMRGEATSRVLLGCKRHGRPGDHSGSQRWERPGWQQTRRPEGYRMTAAA
jgi:hypothetical protein